MALRLSKKQLAALEMHSAAIWDRETAQKLLAFYPSHMSALGASLDEVTAFVRTVRDYAQAYQITSKREVFKLAVIGVSLGAHFPHDPRFENGIAYCLGRTSIPQNRRLVLLSDFVETWLGATWTGEGLDIIGARLVERVSGSQPINDSLHGLVSQSPTIATQAHRQAFLDACLSHADGYGLREAERRFAYVGAALIHGVYWFDDPLIGALRRIVEGAETVDLMRAQMADFYAGFA